MKYEEIYEITCHDVDTNNHLTPTMIFRFMQNSADHQMRDRKPSYFDLFMEGKPLILTRMCVEVLEQGLQYDKITAKTWRCPSKGATLIRCYSLEREGKLIAKAYSTWAIANRNTGGLCRTDDIDISNYEEDQPLKMEIKTRFRLPKDIEYKKVGTKHVNYGDVDMNVHMNNGNYPNMLWNQIPDIINKEVTSINIRFMKEAPLDSNIDIYMGKSEEPIPEDKRAEETYMFLTKVQGEINVEAQICVRTIK